MNKINDISGKLITSDIPVDDAKRSVTLQRAVKYNDKYAATVASFRAMQELTFVQPSSIFVAVEREQYDESIEETEPAQKKEEVHISLQSNTQQQQPHQNYPAHQTTCRQCDQPGHANFNFLIRFQIQQYVTKLVQPEQYGSTAFGRFDHTTRYGVETFPPYNISVEGKSQHADEEEDLEQDYINLRQPIKW